MILLLYQAYHSHFRRLDVYVRADDGFFAAQ